MRNFSAGMASHIIHIIHRLLPTENTIALSRASIGQLSEIEDGLDTDVVLAGSVLVYENSLPSVETLIV